MSDYIIKFGEMYLIDTDSHLGFKRISLTEKADCAARLEKEKAKRLSDKYGGVVMRINVSLEKVNL